MKQGLIQKNDILGDWTSENKEVRMQIYEDVQSGCLNGKITWIIEDESNPNGPVLDTLNPDDSLKQRPIAGLEFITGLVFNEKKKAWQNGQIYDPEAGKTYHLKVCLLDENTLNIRPSVDAMGFLGKSFKWCRLSD